MISSFNLLVEAIFIAIKLDEGEAVSDAPEAKILKVYKQKLIQKSIINYR